MFLLVYVFLGLFSLVASRGIALFEGNLYKCPPNSIGLRLNASICYSFHPSFSQYVVAERECNKFGANLVSLNNKYTNVYVTQLANLFFKHLEVEQFWSIGHRLIDAKTFRWENGDEIENGNLGNKYTEENQDCMSVNLEKGFWKHENCFSRLPFVCEFVGAEKEVPPTAISFETFKKFEMPYQLRPTRTPKTCPPSWTYNNATGFCYGVYHKMNWKNAENKCIQEQAHLTSIHSQEEANFVSKLTEESSAKYDWYGQTQIGFISNDEGQTWEWTDGTPFDFQYWEVHEPNNLDYEYCGQMRRSSKFNNIPCDTIIENFVCKKLPSDGVLAKIRSQKIIDAPIPTITTTTSLPTTTISKPCPNSWTYNNATDQCYGVFHGMKWNDAENKCIQEQAHLTSIHSKEEALFVAKLTEKLSTSSMDFHWEGQTYIGLFTRNRGQTWQWTDGTPFDYQQWYQYQPDHPGYEACGQLYSTSNYYNYKLGDFNNINCEVTIKNFVCKKQSANKRTSPITTTSTTTTIPTTITTTKPKTCPHSWTYNHATGHCYSVFHNLNWNEAENKCNQEQAHLASIHSSEEAIFVAKLAETSSTPIWHYVWRDQTYIGLMTKDQGQTWEWSDGTPFDYNQWYKREPNNRGIENCGEIWSTSNYQDFKLGDFNNCDCHVATKSFVCKKLAE